MAVDAWSAGREVEVAGLPVIQGYRAGLAELVRTAQWGATLELGAVEHVTVPLGEHEIITCVQSGLWLARDDEGAARRSSSRMNAGLTPSSAAISGSSPGEGELQPFPARAFEELRHSTHDLTNALLGARPPTEDFDVS